MSGADPSLQPGNPSTAVCAHHRECVRCGYNLFGQLEAGLCPECGAPVADTFRFPLWSVTQPRRLARSRVGLFLVALSLVVYLSLVLAAILLGVVGMAGKVESVAEICGAILGGAAAITLLTGFVLLGLGAGSSGRKRWLPLTFLIATVAWEMVEASSLLSPKAVWEGIAVGITLVWLTGLALQSLVAHVSTGVAVRAARVQSARFMKVTRLLLFIPVAVIGAAAAVVFFIPDMGSAVWSLLLVIQGTASLIGLWMLLAAIHWLRLLRLWRA